MDGRVELGSDRELNRSRLSVYQQDWWMAIIGKAKGVGEVRIDQDEHVMGSLTYARGGFFGMTQRTLPWSHLTGPVLREGLTSKQASYVLDKMISELPQGALHFTAHSEAPYANEIRAAFKKAGFEVGQQRTYTQKPEDPDPMERIRGYDATAIRDSVKKLDLVQLDAEQFVALYQKHLDERGIKKSYHDLSIAQELIEEGLRREQVLVYGLREKLSPRIQAAVAFTIDGQPVCDNGRKLSEEKRMYATWVTYGKGIHRGALKQVLMEGMRFARKNKLVFDADGVRSDNQADLYHKKLKIPHTEIRDVFLRTTFAARTYQKIKSFPHNSSTFIYK